MKRLLMDCRWPVLAVGVALLLAQRGLWSDDAVITEEPAAPAAAPAPATVALDPNRFPLDFLEDRTELTGEADLQVYYGLLDYVRRVPTDEMRDAAAQFLKTRWQASPYSDKPLENFPLFYDLTQSPDAYRGQPITLRGHLQLHRVRHEDNRYDIDPIHEAYLYTGDSQGHPITVVFTENPDNIPAGETVVNGVSVTGYFLKHYLYPSRDGKSRYSPLIIAKEMRWAPPDGGLSSQDQIILLTVLLLGMFGVVMMLRLTRKRDAAAQLRRKQLLAEDAPPDFEKLDDRTNL